MQTPSNKVSKSLVLAGSAAIITIGFSFSRILGYARLKSLAYVFGSSYTTDAYMAVFNVIDLLYFLLAGGALSAAFIPVFTEYLVTKKEEEGWKTASAAYNLLFAAALLAVLAWELFTPYFVRFLVGGFDEKTHRLCVLLTRMTLPMVLFTVTSAFCAGILNAYGHFAAPVFAYIFYNIPIILVTLLLGPTYGITSLPYGVLLGASLLVLVQMPALRKHRVRYFPAWQPRHPDVSRMVRLFFPAMVGLSISQFNLMFIPQFFASFFSSGIVSSYTYANRIIMLPFGIFAMAVSTVIFPALTRLFQEKDEKLFKYTFAKGISSTLFFVLPSAVALWVLAEPVIKLLYFGGEFGHESVSRTALVLKGYALGLPALSLLQIVTRAFHAQQDTKTPVKVGILSLLLNLFLAYVFVKAFNFSGPALATSGAYCFNVFLLLIFLKRHLDAKYVAASVLKTCFCCAFFASLISVLYPLLLDLFSPGNLLPVGISLFFTLAAGGALYLALSFSVRVEEVFTIRNFIRQKFFPQSK